MDEPRFVVELTEEELRLIKGCLEDAYLNGIPAQMARWLVRKFEGLLA